MSFANEKRSILFTGYTAMGNGLTFEQFKEVAINAKETAVKASEDAIAAATGAGFAVRYLSYAAAGADFSLSSITPDVNIRIGDHVLNSDGDLFRIVAITNGYATLSSTLTSLRGPEGIQGPRGPQGESIVGPQGPQGIPGVQGDPGDGLRVLDTYNTYSVLIANHPTGKPGDAYFVQSDLFIWSASQSAWVNKGKIGSAGGISGVMKPDPREYFLYVLNGGAIEDVEGGGSDYQPILNTGKLDCMVLA